MPVPVLVDYSWQLGDAAGNAVLTLGAGTAYTVGKVDGLFGRSVRTSDYDKANAAGAVMGNDYVDAKSVVMDVLIQGTSAADTEAKAEALLAATVSRGLDNTQTTDLLRWKRPGQLQRRLGGRTRRCEVDWSTVPSRYALATLEFYAPDPRIGSELRTGVDSVPAGTTIGPNGERIVSLVYNAGLVTLTNSGNAPAPVTWQVGGTVTAPAVIRLETDRFDLPGVVVNATGIRVVTDYRTVTRLSDGANIYNLLTGRFLEVPTGTPTFRSVGTTPSGGAGVTATYRDTWL